MGSNPILAASSLSQNSSHPLCGLALLQVDVAPLVTSFDVRFPA
jgi:hypothetical protein